MCILSPLLDYNSKDQGSHWDSDKLDVVFHTQIRTLFFFLFLNFWFSFRFLFLDRFWDIANVWSNRLCRRYTSVSSSSWSVSRSVAWLWFSFLCIDLFRSCSGTCSFKFSLRSRFFRYFRFPVIVVFEVASSAELPIALLSFE